MQFVDFVNFVNKVFVANDIVVIDADVKEFMNYMWWGMVWDFTTNPEMAEKQIVAEALRQPTEGGFDEYEGKWCEAEGSWGFATRAELREMCQQHGATFVGA